MIGILLLFFITRMFYRLADTYKRSKWLYAILSIVVYYGVTILFYFIVRVIISLNPNTLLSADEELILGLVGIPFGLGALWLLYTLLKRNWSSKGPKTAYSELLDTDLE